MKRIEEVASEDEGIIMVTVDGPPNCNKTEACQVAVAALKRLYPIPEKHVKFYPPPLLIGSEVTKFGDLVEQWGEDRDDKEEAKILGRNGGFYDWITPYDAMNSDKRISLGRYVPLARRNLTISLQHLYETMFPLSLTEQREVRFLNANPGPIGIWAWARWHMEAEKALMKPENRDKLTDGYLEWSLKFIENALAPRCRELGIRSVVAIPEEYSPKWKYARLCHWLEVAAKAEWSQVLHPKIVTTSKTWEALRDAIEPSWKRSWGRWKTVVDQIVKDKGEESETEKDN